MAAATSTINIISISSETKRRIHPPRLSTSTDRINNIPPLPLRISRTQKCNFTIVSGLPPPPPPPLSKTRFGPSTKLYVSGLSFRTTEESLENAFKPFGELLEVKLVMDNIANRPKGFGFVRYATEDESRKAIEGMHGKNNLQAPSQFLDGRVIFVEYAKPRSEVHQGLKQKPKLT